MSEPDGDRTPWQIQRDNVEQTGDWPEITQPYHRHFANGAVHRDGGPECDQPGTPRRVYVFDSDYLDEHERIVARYAAQHPEQFLEAAGNTSADRQVIVCNYQTPTRVASRGARAYVVPQLGGNLPERARVLVRSRGGRWVEKWESVAKLCEFRLKTLPPGHPRYADERLWPSVAVTQADVDRLESARREVTARRPR